jgi:polyisoprenoid-binding protein YceI
MTTTTKEAGMSITNRNHRSGGLISGSWQLDPQRSSIEFRAGHFWGLATVQFLSDAVDLHGDTLKVHGRLSARGRSIPVELDARVRRVDDELEIEAATTTPHQELGMTWSPLGMIRPRSELFVKAYLTANEGQIGSAEDFD